METTIKQKRRLLIKMISNLFIYPVITIYNYRPRCPPSETLAGIEYI